MLETSLVFIINKYIFFRFHKPSSIKKHNCKIISSSITLYKTLLPIAYNFLFKLLFIFRADPFCDFQETQNTYVKNGFPSATDIHSFHFLPPMLVTAGC